MATKLTLSQACEGLIYYKQATGKSPATIDAYRHAFGKLRLHFSHDPPIADITRQDLIAFFAWLQNDHISTPNGIAPRPARKLAPKTVHNIYVNTAALWQWATDEGYTPANLVRTIDRPHFEPPAIQTFTKDEIKALLIACKTSAAWQHRPATANARPTCDRDQAIVLLLLDTGIRASELRRLTLADVDLSAHRLLVCGKGKGRGKQRIVHFGRSTGRALWRYLTPRLSADTHDADPVFAADPEGYPRPFTRSGLASLLRRLGERAGLTHRCHPHKFRHTFAINYLRNEGDPFTLQELLGHTDLTMVRRYVRLAQADIAAVHRRASPVDNWRL